MYDESFDGGTVTLNKGINQFISGGLSYTLEAARVAINSGFTTNSTTTYVPAANGLTSTQSVTPPNISTNIYDEHGTDLINQFGLTLAYDSRKAIKDNDRGAHIQFEADAATPPGDADFYKLELKSSFYFRGFRQGDILEIDARGGVVAPYGDSSHIPIYERWFLGGLYSLRGFRYRQVGPQDEFGEPLGGDTYFFAGAEYSIPLAKIVRLAWFYDMGNVFANPYSFKLSNRQENFFEDDVGMGLRIVLPLGGGMPLRVDWAFPITYDSSIDVGHTGRIQIGIGYTRDF
jgi:outer membrane protein insertion porin family